MARTYQVILEWDDRTELWVASVPALNYLSTYSDDRDDVLEESREAIAGYLEAAAKQGIEIPWESHPIELADVEVEEP